MQPVIKWTGSKRHLANEIISFFPKEIEVYYEPFCGGCSILYNLLHKDIKINRYVCSDINNDLISIFNLIKTAPYQLVTDYKYHWNELKSCSNETKQGYYNYLREEYNITRNPSELLFLSRTCINGLIRYNKSNEFNSAFHHNRDGINPDKFAKIVYDWNIKIDNIEFITQSYTDIQSTENDFLYLDPPYFNTSSCYNGELNINSFVQWLRNQYRYALSFNGIRSNKDTTYKFPKELYDKHVYLSSKPSSYRRLQGNNESVKESLYIKF